MVTVYLSVLTIYTYTVSNTAGPVPNELVVHTKFSAEKTKIKESGHLFFCRKILVVLIGFMNSFCHGDLERMDLKDGTME